MRLDNYIVHCRTKDQAKIFLGFCIREGYECFDGDTNWTHYKSNTCYRIENSNRSINYGSLGSYSLHSNIYSNYLIIPFEDFMRLHRHRVGNNKIGYTFND